MRDGFIKIAAATPDLHAADCAYNTSEIVKLAKEAAAKGAKLITFPELCLTGYTCGDLFLQETLLEGAMQALGTVCRETAELAAVIVVGLPLRVRGKLYNVAAVINAGDVLAFVPKTHLPNYSEFYEQRHFVSADTLSGGMEGVDVKNADGETICVPLVTDSIFQCDEQPLFTFGVEICEDLWVPNPPSTALAQMGAHIIVNLSASDEIIGKASYRRDLVRQQSGRLLCAYLYADAGFGESTQDLVFAGHDLIAENGALLAESKMFTQGIIYADIDLQRLAHERQRMNTFESIEGGVFSFSLEPVENDLADRTFPRTPFVPANKALRDERCEEILTLQATVWRPVCAIRTRKRRLSVCPADWIPRSRLSCSYTHSICWSSTARAFWLSPCRASAQPPVPRATQKSWRKPTALHSRPWTSRRRSISISWTSASPRTICLSPLRTVRRACARWC